MVNRFLRTAPTRTLLATIAGLVAVVGGGSAIALAARGEGPVPKREPLAVAVRVALGAPQVNGVSADISFTNGLIGASELQGSDPLLQGGSGHVWVSGTGRQFRLELYGDNGDPEIVVNNTSWWISDPTLQTVYEGTLPPMTADKHTTKADRLPTLAQIQAGINKLAQHLNLSGAAPTDVGGRPAYTVTVSPKQAGGLLGGLQLAWDAVHGVPLRFAVYARGDSKPVLEIAASNISYGLIDQSVFNLTPPAGYHAVNVATPTATAPASEPAGKGRRAGSKGHADVTGVKAVSKRLGFNVVAPGRLSGMARRSVSLLGHGTHPSALVLYGQGLGTVGVLEQSATAMSARQLQLSHGSGDHQVGISLPTFSVNGRTAQELDTAIGTVIRFTSGGLTYTVVGSVTPRTARAVARAL